MEPQFATEYKTILDTIDRIDPIQYAKTRNYVDGAVTYLSPYISRGFISTKQVLENVLARGYKVSAIESLVKELCWRDYFQRVAQQKDLNKEIKQAQLPVLNHEMPLAVINGNTGIKGIDIAIAQLYCNGYMHNHCRMYTAALVCNIAKSHWLHPAQWMYYYLLDGDWASNACSWQWVAGANSSKKYYANQENINKYTNTNDVNTFLDKSYEALQTSEVPIALKATQKFIPEIELPVAAAIQINPDIPTFIYNYYNLDPLWHKAATGSRILLIEPEFFNRYPVSKKCINFMLALSINIANIQVYVGSFQSLVETHQLKEVYYKEHPLNIGYAGNEDARDWIAEDVTGYYPSFFSYWKKVEKQFARNN
jgi:deoxyribodipyrimidine photo-lyase